MEKIGNQGNPLALAESEALTLVDVVCALLVAGPPLTSARYRAQLATARQEGKRFVALLRTRGPSRPH